MIRRFSYLAALALALGLSVGSAYANNPNADLIKEMKSLPDETIRPLHPADGDRLAENPVIERAS